MTVPPVSAHWAEIRAGSAKAFRAFETARTAPDAAQRELLSRILAENAETAFGRTHGFDRIDSLEAYRAAVPIRRYDGFAAEIDRMAEGVPDRLFKGPLLAFERTGGTRSGGKRIPFGPAQLEAFAAAVLPMFHDLVVRHGSVSKGRLYASISPATRPTETTPGGHPVGLASDAAYLGPLAAPFAHLLAVPPDLGAIPDVDTWRVATLARLVEAGDLSFVTVWSPSFLTALIEALPGLADEIAPQLSGPARLRLERWLGADAGQGTAPLWPQLAAISAWTDASSAPFAARLATLCPQATIVPKGVIATEGPITVPTGDGPGAWPALTSTFIEFREPGTTRCHLASSLEPGGIYEVILTTRGGLYRYDIGDRFRCVAVQNGCPRLTFEGRAGVVSDMVGEKLEEGFVARALATLDTPARLEAVGGPAPHYRLVTARRARPGDLLALDTALAANPQYAYARRIGQLGPLQPGNTRYDPAAEAQARARAGQRLSDAKPAVLVPLTTTTD